MPTSCGNCASMRPGRYNGAMGYCSTLLMHRRTDTLVECPHWESDAAVRAELMGLEHHNPATCGQCVCYNASHARQGSCAPVGVRARDARACHRFFSTTELNRPVSGWPGQPKATR